MVTRILLADLGNDRSENLTAYQRRGGYRGLQRALTSVSKP